MTREIDATAPSETAVSLRICGVEKRPLCRKGCSTKRQDRKAIRSAAMTAPQPRLEAAQSERNANAQMRGGASARGRGSRRSFQLQQQAGMPEALTRRLSRIVLPE